MKKIQLDDFTRFKFLSGLGFSGDGENLCFCASACNVDDNSYDSNLWIYNIKTNKSYQLTAFNEERGYIWLKDDETILFQGLRDKEDKKKREQGLEFSQFYKINIHGGEATKAFSIPLSVSDIIEVDEDTFLFTADHKVGSRDFYQLNEEEKEERIKASKEDKDYEVLEEIPFWSNGGGFTSKKRNRLFKYSVKAKEITPITADTTSVYGVVLNEGKDKAIFTCSTYEGKAPLKDELYLYDLKTNKTTLLSEDEFSHGLIDFIDDDTLILGGSDMKSYGINEDGKFYTFDIKTKTRKLFTPDFDESLWNSVGSDCRYGGGKNVVKDGGNLYFITTVGDSSYINKLDLLTGNIKRITESKGSVDCYDVINGQIAMIALREQKLQEVYTLESGKEIQLTEFNKGVLQDYSVIKPENLQVETAPGVIIQGWVLKPADFDSNKKYPGILDIHGGPKTVYGEVYYHEMQLWANMGYFVFFCNPRGSDGRGADFADIRGKYGTIDYEDIMKFTDAVLEKYSNIDGDRVGVTGGSYGGFMTNWIIGHTDRFKAAASQRSISNWISKFCTTDIGYYFVDDQNEGTPWGNMDKLWFHSPLKYADKVKTPTLFIHSEEDYRCWLAEGLQMFTALKYHGVEARLCMFRGENHELSRSGRPKHRIKRLSEITNWFESHLK